MKFLLFVLFSVFVGFTLPATAAKRGEWTVLFDGASTEQWKGFRTDGFPAESWEIRDGVLTSISKGQRIDLVTREVFADFELFLEWRVEEEGNSGLFYRVSEEPDLIWHGAPEVQILDDKNQGNPFHSAGSLYDLLPPSDRKILRPVGKFNASRLIVRGSQAEYWLNGKRILAYDLDDPLMKQKIAESKFGSFAAFGETKNGLIGLQHHGDAVGFRNIRIRKLH